MTRNLQDDALDALSIVNEKTDKASVGARASSAVDVSAKYSAALRICLTMLCRHTPSAVSRQP
jgi:hypothetical protein